MNAIEYIGWATVIVAAWGLLIAAAWIAFRASVKIVRLLFDELWAWYYMLSYVAWCQGDSDRARDMLKSALNAEVEGKCKACDLRRQRDALDAMLEPAAQEARDE